MFDLLKSLLTPYFASVIIAQKVGYHVLDYQKHALYCGGGGVDISFFIQGMGQTFQHSYTRGGNKYFSTQWWGGKHFLYTGGDKCFYPRRRALIIHSSIQCPLLFVPRGTDISHTQLGGRGQTFFIHSGGTKNRSLKF